LSLTLSDSCFAGCWAEAGKNVWVFAAAESNALAEDTQQGGVFHICTISGGFEDFVTLLGQNHGHINTSSSELGHQLIQNGDLFPVCNCK
jgi:hypothetical protein